MQDFAGKVAVVTGAASGMGLSFAHRFADEGMNIVLADIESEPLAMAEAAIKAKGVKTLAVRSNVMHEEAVNELADRAFSTFGNVHILCNNAGVITRAATLRSRPWETPLADWEWTLGVNFWGVLYGIRAFVPRMLENGDEGHIVNTASSAGLLTGANPYNVSKHAVVCLTEGIYKEFRAMQAKLSASVLCPGLIRTAILDAARNLPPEFSDATSGPGLRPDQQRFESGFEAGIANGISPDDVAVDVFEAVRNDKFYIIPAQPNVRALIHARLTDIMEERNPTTAI